MAKNILEQLMENEKPFGLMSAEMQEKAREIGAKIEHFGCLATDKDEECWTGGIRGRFVFGLTYRLRPDYEEEPEIVAIEIYLCPPLKNYFVYDKGANFAAQTLCNAVNDPDFIGFKFESGQVELSPIVFKSGCSTKSICQFRDLADLTVLHATHVLFRQKKQE